MLLRCTVLCFLSINWSAGDIKGPELSGGVGEISGEAGSLGLSANATDVDVPAAPLSSAKKHKGAGFFGMFKSHTKPEVAHVMTHLVGCVLSGRVTLQCFGWCVSEPCMANYGLKSENQMVCVTLHHIWVITCDCGVSCGAFPPFFWCGIEEIVLNYRRFLGHTRERNDVKIVTKDVISCYLSKFCECLLGVASVRKSCCYNPNLGVPSDSVFRYADAHASFIVFATCGMCAWAGSDCGCVGFATDC